MILEQILTLLREGHKDPETGKVTEIPIKEIFLGESLLDNCDKIIRELSLGDNPIIVCDEITNEVLGTKLENKLKLDVLVLVGDVKADENRVSEIREKAKDNSALIAVGSGTISDLCKFASYKDQKPYIVFPTALSMNGYASANATIETTDGYKKSFPAHLPQAILFYQHTISSAPIKMNAAGFADTICRSTVQADWLLSHLILGTKYDQSIFGWLNKVESELIEHVGLLAEGDSNTSNKLANALILSGLGMYVCGGSYPASQGEHMIAHTMEMLHGNTIKPSLHGEQIAVTTLTMSRLQEFMLIGRPVIESKPIDEDHIFKVFDNDLGHHCIDAFKKKHLDKEKARNINDLIEKEWDNIVEKIRGRMVPHYTLENTLRLAGAPTKPEDLGWNSDTYRNVVKNALFTRDRFTFLDLAYYSGKLDEFLDTI